MFYLNEDKFPVLIGGEHSVSIGAIKASFDTFENLTVLQLDAHADLRDKYMGSKYSHACVMARVKEMGPFIQVGIRSMSHQETKMINRSRLYYANEIADKLAWMDRVLAQLTENVYITIDLDVFDPAIMPSTGTPEPGGLNWYTVMRLLEKVAHHKRLVGFDVVELCPNAHNKAPDFLAAKLIYQLLSNNFCHAQFRSRSPVNMAQAACQI
ncbi:agmatinase [Rhodoferax sp. 4810]|nr:agmatinase [Rhodoferax jenense]